MIFEHTDYRSFLRATLVQRQARNKAYSLRAMARDLELKPAHLSALMKGRNGLSDQSAMRISEALGLTRDESEFFSLMVQLNRAKTPKLKNAILEKMRAFKRAEKLTDLSVDLFSAIAEWYHIPILEMTGLNNFNFTVDHISKKLGITKLEAQTAIERLVRLELLEQTQTGNYQKVVSNYLFKSNKPNAALRSFHKQMLAKASESLEAQSPKERYVGSQTFVIDPTQLEAATEILNNCRRQLVTLFEQGQSKTQLYHLGLQLFNLTKTGEQK